MYASESSISNGCITNLGTEGKVFNVEIIISAHMGELLDRDLNQGESQIVSNNTVGLLVRFERFSHL